MPHNGDTHRLFKVGTDTIRGVGSYHKSLPHNQFGEVCPDAFDQLVAATEGDGSGFSAVPKGTGDAAPLTNPQAGLAADQLTHHPAGYAMPPAPTVLSPTTAAEMTELYWMALLRDTSLDKFQDAKSPEGKMVAAAAAEIQTHFSKVAHKSDPEKLLNGIDIPGSAAKSAEITPDNVFRIGLPGEEVGPMVSQFFVRSAAFGTQTIDQRQLPYKRDCDYLTSFPDWLHAQNSGRDRDGQAYPKANEKNGSFFESTQRYIGSMRDLARFVNKDALHQAYFNAALILLSGGARWTPGNPYGDCGPLQSREAGFGTLGGPHILALVSEVATRALKIVWNQKWQVNLRLRPEAYGGLVHVENEGVGGTKRPYKLALDVKTSHAAGAVKKKFGSYLLPMAFTPGSPTHPAYGAGHATVAGACVTVLKAYFQTFETVSTPQGRKDIPIPFVYHKDQNPKGLKERNVPHGESGPIEVYETGLFGGSDNHRKLPKSIADQLTIEGELNKLAHNVAMGRSMGGVHWRTDNTRSLRLGETIAAEILADITTDLNEDGQFEFRTFARDTSGTPRKVTIRHGRIWVNGVQVDTHGGTL